MDIYSKEKRSDIMSKVRSKNTKVEILVFKELRKREIYFQKHYNRVPGNPDIALPRKKLAIFVDGDFWHGRSFKEDKDKLNDFWRNKIEANMQRDRKQDEELKRRGWKVLRVWEYEIEKEFDRTVNRIVAFLQDEDPRAKPVSVSQALRAVDFFCGAGGLTYGLRRAGITVIAGIDNDGSCKETYESNNVESLFLEKDLTKYTPKELGKELGIKRNNDYLVFAGCAPCQFWTIVNTSKAKSEKTKDLLLDFLKFIQYFKPGFVIVENVPGISFKKGSPMSEFMETLKSLGYNISYGITDMSLYGVPQKRKRFTLLASRVSKIALPEPTNNKKTVKDVLGAKNGFPKIEAGTKDESSFMHSSAGLSEKNLERLRMTAKDGGNRFRWSKIKEYQLDCYSDDEKIFRDTYARMWWDKPSPTITTKFYSVSNGRFAHPEENRGLSLREGATLQTFPAEYDFKSDKITWVARMIGNAVPPVFAEILGKTIIKAAESAGEDA